MELQNLLRSQLERLKEEKRYRPLTVWESGSGPWMNVGGRRMLQMSSNNYLGFPSHPQIVHASVKALEAYGAGSGSVRAIAGTLDLHERLERELAAFKGTEASLAFTSGYAANLGILSGVLEDEDIVISDELNHASIIDGLRLGRTKRKIYQHNDMNHLEEVLKECSSYRVRMIVTDGVFSMDGDIAPLPDIVRLAESYQAAVYVDDAHGSGVLGRSGKGTVDHYGLTGRVAIQVGTLSKALGAVGGYAAGSSALKDILVHKARSFLFSTSLPPAVTAACLGALSLLQKEPGRVERLRDNADYFRGALQAAGFNTGGSATPIIPLITGTPADTMAFSDRLYEMGIFAQAIIYPLVPLDKGRVRLIVSSEHTRDDLDFALSAIREAGERCGML